MGMLAMVPRSRSLMVLAENRSGVRRPAEKSLQSSELLLHGCRRPIFPGQRQTQVIRLAQD